MVAECAAWAAEQGLTLYGLLQKIYSEYGYRKESLVSLVRKGKSGAEEIQRIMADFRQNPPGGDCRFEGHQGHRLQRAGKDRTPEVQCSPILQRGRRCRLRPSFRHRAEDQVLLRSQRPTPTPSWRLSKHSSSIKLDFYGFHHCDACPSDGEFIARKVLAAMDYDVPGSDSRSDNSKS